MKQFFVKQSGLRVDVFLAQQLGVSRMKAKALCQKACVFVVDKVLKASFILELGMLVSVKETDLVSDDLFNDALFSQVSFLYEDEAILVLNKPAGLLVHPSVQQQEGTLVQMLMQAGVSLSSGFMLDRPGIVHRLDRDTEGVMVIAKTDQAQDSLQKQFMDRHVDKLYYALVYGAFGDEARCLSYPILRHATKRHMYCVHPQGRAAFTDVSQVQGYGSKSLLCLRPKTGRTHQLRVHMLHIGFPILEDPTYNKQSKSRSHRATGQLLQAYYLAFDHPVSQKRYCFELAISDRLKERC
eukprot:COSAG01_NODE_2_length_63927_cov_1357.611941_28_plen_297_part_00